MYRGTTIDELMSMVAEAQRADEPEMEGEFDEYTAALAQEMQPSQAMMIGVA
jgi:hypothetical protein